MKIGTKSILFGAHCFLIHPLFVLLAWWKLYGFPWDPRLWIAFFVHDLGYWGKPNMDGPEGETHPDLGAKIMSVFDRGIKTWEYQYWQYSNKGVWWLNDNWSIEINRLRQEGWIIINIGEVYTILERPIKNTKWEDFTRNHSRFYAKKRGLNFSKLCVADKLAIAIEPGWLYLPRIKWSGEIKEYTRTATAQKENGEKYNNSELIFLNSGHSNNWLRAIQSYLRRWAMEHKDCKFDTWTPERE
jgi:hypothetical protein